MKKKILFISSTGGHLSELLQLSSLIEENQSLLITENTKSNKKLKQKYDKVSYLIYGTKSHFFTYIFKFIINTILSLYYYVCFRPDIIITTGAHTCVPISFIGKLFGSKIIYIETFANFDSKTMTGKIVYPIADIFFVQWESMLKLYPKAKYEGRVY